MNNLTKATFVASLVGIFFLIMLAQQLPVKIENIEDVTQEDLNQKVGVIGKIKLIRDLDGFQIIILEDDTGIIDILTNSDNPINKTNNDLLIIGRVSEYKENIQISADKIVEIED